MLVAAGLAAFAAWWRPTHNPRSRTRVLASVPTQGERVIVEVLNAADAAGLGRIATRRLRDAGLDVVYFGTDTAQALDSTQILVRRGSDMAPAERVKRALGAGLVRAVPDSTRLVDVTVRLGRDLAGLAGQP